jgi:hypothetical protein
MVYFGIVNWKSCYLRLTLMIKWKKMLVMINTVASLTLEQTNHFTAIRESRNCVAAYICHLQSILIAMENCE